jgi:hypothetical protein
MADHPTRLLLGRTSQDIAVTAGCLKAIGAKIDMSEEGHIDVFPLPIPGGTPSHGLRLTVWRADQRCAFFCPLRRPFAKKRFSQAAAGCQNAR